jgi:hypothetical protein
MKTPDSPLDYYKFSFLIKNKSRDPNGSWCKNFLDFLLATCKIRIIELPEKTQLWRSQLGRDKSIITFAGGSFLDTSLKPFPVHRMKPLHQKVKEGRANSNGVPVLYLSTDRETAMAECRPWIAAHISIGRFYITKNLKILDLSKDEFIPVGIDDIEGKKEDQKFAETVIWGGINKAFTKPHQRTDQSMDYIPTQKIAEFFKNHGFDGLQYKSALGVGYNIALFDLSLAEQADCSLFDVQSIQYSFEPIEGAKYKTQFGENLADCEDI